MRVAAAKLTMQIKVTSDVTTASRNGDGGEEIRRMVWNPQSPTPVEGARLAAGSYAKGEQRAGDRFTGRGCRPRAVTRPVAPSDGPWTGTGRRPVPRSSASRASVWNCGIRVTRGRSSAAPGSTNILKLTAGLRVYSHVSPGAISLWTNTHVAECFRMRVRWRLAWHRPLPAYRKRCG
jgi:hypothetical protein